MEGILCKRGGGCEVSFYKRVLVYFLLLLAQMSTVPAFAGNGFFNEIYRGWIWFEDNPKVEDSKIESEELASSPTEEDYAQARKEVEEFSALLEKHKFMMLRYPNNLEHIKRYKETEAILLNNAMILSQNYRLVNFLNPELDDELQNPVNLWARKIKKEVEKNAQEKELKELAGKVELFLFFSETCPYCKTLEKHLATFAKTFGFKVTAISPDNSKSQYFESHMSPILIEKLALEVMPTVIAVTNDSSIRFEVARGAVSIDELKEKSILMAERMKDLEKDFRQSEGREWQVK